MMTEIRRIGRYELISELGKGGMAVVYRALDTHVNREVALKLLSPQYHGDHVFLKRFLKECQNTYRLRHPNIVRTFDAGHIDSHYYMVMELIEGQTLADLLQQRNSLLPFRQTIDILSQIASALDYAHSLGILHRDIKPTNILMGNDGRVLLSDFGAAKNMSSDYTMITATGQSIGTPSYMSPEQARGEKGLDYHTDVYSLGVLAYKLFTGRMPFIGDSQPEILFKIVYDRPQDPQIVNADIPDAIANVLRKVLSKEPQLRYESAGTFVAAIVASKRWRINVAEELTRSVKTTQVPAVVQQKSWKGLQFAVGVLVTVIVIVALSSMSNARDALSRLEETVQSIVSSSSQIQNFETHMSVDLSRFGHWIEQQAVDGLQLPEMDQIPAELQLTSGVKDHGPKPPLQPIRPQLPTQFSGSVQSKVN